MKKYRAVLEHPVTVAYFQERSPWRGWNGGLPRLRGQGLPPRGKPLCTEEEQGKCTAYAHSIEGTVIYVYMYDIRYTAV